MPFDSSGVFNRVIAGGWVADAAANIKIRADRHDLEDDGFAVGLSTCITKDGRTMPTANLPMNGKRHTNVGEPVDPFDGATKKYVDDRFGTVFNITGIDDAGRIIFSGSQSPLATGKPLGLGFTQADLFFGVKPLDVESAGKKPRFVFNNKGDGMGTDVVTIEETGALETKSSITSSAGSILTKGSGNIHYWFHGPNAEDRGVIYTTGGSATGLVLRNSTSQQWAFATDGQFYSPSNVRAAGTVLQTDGNIIGPIWSGWGASDAFSAINARIESRAQAWAAAHVANAFTQARMAGAVDVTHSGTTGLTEYGGYVITGSARPAGGQVYLFRYRQPQLYSQNAGWVVPFAF